MGPGPTDQTVALWEAPFLAQGHQQKMRATQLPHETGNGDLQNEHEATIINYLWKTFKRHLKTRRVHNDTFWSTAFKHFCFGDTMPWDISALANKQSSFLARIHHFGSRSNMKQPLPDLKSPNNQSPILFLADSSAKHEQNFRDWRHQWTPTLSHSWGTLSASKGK